MGWTAPRDWTVGEIVTEAMMDTHVKNNLRYLKGLDGVPTIESGLTIDNTDGDERLLLPLLSTAECSTVLNVEGEVAFDEQTHRVKIYDNDGVESLVSTADVDDTPVNGATTDPVSSNWAYDHITDADQHPEYQKESLLTTAGDIAYATGASTWARLAIGTAGQLLRTNAGATAPEWASVVAVNVYKTADETVNNSTAFQDDNELLFAVGANKAWSFEVCVLMIGDAGGAADIKFQFTTPAGGTVYVTDASSIAQLGATGALTSGLAAKYDILNSTKMMLMWGVYIGGANAGNVTLQWAQNAAVEADTKVLAGSHILAWQLA